MLNKCEYFFLIDTFLEKVSQKARFIKFVENKLFLFPRLEAPCLPQSPENVWWQTGSTQPYTSPALKRKNLFFTPNFKRRKSKLHHFDNSILL